MTTTEPDLPVRNRHDDPMEFWNNHNRFSGDMRSIGEKVYAVDVVTTWTTRVIIGADGPNHAADLALQQVSHAFGANTNHDANAGEYQESSTKLAGTPKEIDPHGYVDRFARPVAVAYEMDHERGVVTLTYGDGSRRAYGLGNYEGPWATREDRPPLSVLWPK